MVVVADDAHDSRLLYEVNGLKCDAAMEYCCVVYQMQFNQTTVNKKPKEKQTNKRKQMDECSIYFYTRVKLINAKMIGIRIDVPPINAHQVGSISINECLDWVKQKKE